MSTFRFDDRTVQAIAPLVMGETASDPDRLARAAAAAVWSSLAEPGDAVAGMLVAALGADSALVETMGATRPDLMADAAGLAETDVRAGLRRWRLRLDAEEIALAFERARHAHVKLLTPDDDAWPRALDDLGPFAPLCLWVKGDPGVLGRLDPAIAIVGARAATGYGEHIAGEFAAGLAARGVAVVSGAAYGIDGAAHRGALSVGGTTVAMLAGGVDRPYPAGHTDLLRRIAASGAVASEVPCGGVPSKWRFLQRNRTIAALGGATIVVEAGWRSGSINTAGHASSLGRPLGAVPGPVTSGSSAGCHRILREFDSRCVTTAEEAAELLGLTPSGAAQPGEEGTTGDRTRVTDALSTRSWRTVEDIARRSGMAPEEAAGHLGLLALEGGAEAQGSRWRRVAAGVPV
jgi:DNA processing protein